MIGEKGVETMRKVKILISIFLVLIIFTSCSFKSYENIIFSKTEENYGDTGGIDLPIDINNTEIKIMIVSDVDELSDSLVVKELSRRTGLKINIMNVLPSDSMRQAQLLFSTNELPDIIKTTLDIDEINNLGKKGTFVSVNKYLAELPNFRRIFIEDEKYNHVMNDYSASDNNLYFYPEFDFQKEFTDGFLYRKDIFEKNNLPMWNNKEEFYNTLKALKQIYPDSTPYVSQSENNIFSEWSLSFGIDFPGMFYDYDKSEWIYSGCDIRFIEMLDFIKKLYDEKLIDSKFLTTSSYLWDWKISGESGFVTYGKLSNINAVPKIQSEGVYDFRLSFANPPGNYFRFKKNSITGPGPSVTNNKNSLLSLKLLDYLSSPSGIELSTLGLINRTYEYIDGQITYSDVEKNKTVNEKSLEEKYGLFIPGLYRSVDKRSSLLKYSKGEQDVLTELYKKDAFLKEEPYIKLSDEERQSADEIEKLINNKALEYAINYILGFEVKPFNEWVLEAEKMGLSKLKSIYNKQER